MSVAIRNPDITAAILAGGQGARIGGRDKGLVLLGGTPLIEHVSRAIAAQAGHLLICANRNSQIYAAFGQVVPDRGSGFRGPLAGIAAALAACETPWLLTVPVDSPHPPADLAERLHAAVQGGAGADVTVASDGTRTQPLFALYRRTLASAAAAALESDLAVWRWQQDRKAVTVDFSDRADDFTNLNTEQEFRSWEQRQDD